MALLPVKVIWPVPKLIERTLALDDEKVNAVRVLLPSTSAPAVNVYAPVAVRTPEVPNVKVPDV